jgi:hypothetical protein
VGDDVVFVEFEEAKTNGKVLVTKIQQYGKKPTLAFTF